MSDSQKKRLQDPIELAKHKKRVLTAIASPEYKEKYTVAYTKFLNDSERVKLWKENLKKAANTPEARKNNSERNLKYYSDPINRLRIKIAKRNKTCKYVIDEKHYEDFKKLKPCIFSRKEFLTFFTCHNSIIDRGMLLRSFPEMIASQIIKFVCNCGREPIYDWFENKESNLDLSSYVKKVKPFKSTNIAFLNSHQSDDFKLKMSSIRRKFAERYIVIESHYLDFKNSVSISFTKNDFINFFMDIKIENEFFTKHTILNALYRLLKEKIIFQKTISSYSFNSTDFNLENRNLISPKKLAQRPFVRRYVVDEKHYSDFKLAFPNEFTLHQFTIFFLELNLESSVTKLSLKKTLHELKEIKVVNQYFPKKGRPAIFNWL